MLTRMSKTQKLDDKQILSKLAKDFHELVTNKEVLRSSVESFLNNVIDELTLGIIFDLHRKYKTNSYEIEMEEDDGDEEEVDIFAQQDVKKQDCVCPICDRAVAALRFAPHLEKCLGMGRTKFRNATRRVASSTSKERENSSSFSGVPSDDEDDMDWNSGGKRGKKKKRNGSKKSKSGGTPKKSCESKANESSTVEVEAEDDDLSSLRDLLQDHSNSSSPADSVSSSHSNSSKKKEKMKSKKSKRDRSSPSSSISAE